jgi:hypothetical protein
VDDIRKLCLYAVQTMAMILYLAWLDIFRDYYFFIVSDLCLTTVYPLACFHEINKYRL